MLLELLLVLLLELLKGLESIFRRIRVCLDHLLTSGCSASRSMPLSRSQTRRTHHKRPRRSTIDPCPRQLKEDVSAILVPPFYPLQELLDHGNDLRIVGTDGGV
jgi:hypothetical protein